MYKSIELRMAMMKLKILLPVIVYPPILAMPGRGVGNALPDGPMDEGTASVLISRKMDKKAEDVGKEIGSNGIERVGARNNVTFDSTLSERRARAVAYYRKQQGVSASRMTTVFRERHPVVSNDSEKDRGIN
jgi:hypothetical protein